MEYWTNGLQMLISSMTLNCTSDDKQCTAFKNKLMAENMFAIQQLDAFGKIPANILGPNLRWQGSWEECINIKNGVYEGEFYWIGLAPNLNVLAGGAGSEAEDTLKLFSSTINNIGRGMLAACTADPHPAHSPPKKFWFWAVCGVCLFIGFLMVLSTLVDYATESEDNTYKRIRESGGMKALLAFSIYSNGAEILDARKRPGQILSMNCIRAVSMSWVIIGHTSTCYSSAENAVSFMNAKRYFLNQAFFNAFLSVDSFLFIGGVLLGYLFFKDIQRNRRNLVSPVYWALYYIHRYIRLTIPYITFLGFYTIIYPYLVKGPVQLTTYDIDYCKSYWWRNLLYINNFFKMSEMCMGHSWYLSTDMQIYCFSPLLLIPLALSPIAGGVVTIALVVMSLLSTYLTYNKYEFPATIVKLMVSTQVDLTLLDPFMRWIYMAPWVRCLTNIMGILTGYLLFRVKDKKIRFHWIAVVLLWAASIAIGIGCIYSLFDYLNDRSDMNSQTASTYYVFHRVGWCLALAWVIFACQHNMAGLIKNFMEHSFWIPIARISYCSYLVHMFFMIVVFAQEKGIVHYNSMTALYIHSGLPVFLISFGVAFVWSCAFEIPFAKLEKMVVGALLRRPRRPQPQVDKLPALEQQPVLKIDNQKKDDTNPANDTTSPKATTDLLTNSENSNKAMSSEANERL
uniref:NRF domain-containing protein n=1 Tax=Syphacia muris TaxID=451379 RepID=A0A0N5AAU6_9BILA